ncbi:MAG TPA: aspartate 1-decarboxylase [Candidatus Omnitrophota bacterium]|nr:aspartate 1-decarboxylase [Candidatus Omnitrophota bacterium]
MWIQFCKSKIAFAKVTQADLHYEGSITIDKNLMDAVGIIPGEKVEVLNLNNGNRFETYTIAGRPGEGQVCLNGPAARLGLVGDKVIILSYAMMDQEEAKKYQMKAIQLNDDNKIKNKS